MRTLHEVSGCGRCPMAFDGYCCHPSNQFLGREIVGAHDTDEHRYETEAHELCPLRKGDLLITLKVKR